MPNLGAGVWSPSEETILTEAVERYSSSTREKFDWHAIAAQLPGRSNKDCRKKWTCCLAPHIKKGPWDAVEDQLLRQAVGCHGMKWPYVAQQVGTRQPDLVFDRELIVVVLQECARRWHEAAKPNINRGRWSLMENAVRAHGRKWTEIVERYFPERTPIGAKSRLFGNWTVFLKALKSGKEVLFSG
ncbi:hypothetical protein BKA65DRAFT_534915 [Rhexocercosporidium sp. MPI-PUGE-AT-0058]|nr:hypothetical protein BKA65DRAFT_534915 [Rhexocercosporidium sp. MPI-PUGE-AT-0058]